MRHPQPIGMVIKEKLEGPPQEPGTKPHWHISHIPGGPEPAGLFPVLALADCKRWFIIKV